jgi:hypothetical protein
MEREKFVRPQDVATIVTSDPKVMLGKYLPKRVVKEWFEDFRDDDTGEVVSIERKEVLMERGLITNEKVSKLLFYIQAGDIDEVEVCERDVSELELFVPNGVNVYKVVLYVGMDKYVCVVRAQTVMQAAKIAWEYGQMYRGLNGYVTVHEVKRMSCYIIPDDHPCLPVHYCESQTVPYFMVQVRTEWIEGEKKSKSDVDYIVAAQEVGEAKSLVESVLAYEDEKNKREKLNGEEEFIRKAIPFSVDYIVPKEYSELYKEEPSI